VSVAENGICQLLPLSSVAPDLVEAIVGGRQPKRVRLVEMLGNGRLVGKSNELKGI
jgi:hypothetical protein